MLTRLRLHFRQKDRGSLLIEAIAGVGLMAVLMTGVTTASTSASQTQNKAVNQVIATQHIQGQLEKARSLNWDEVGTPGTNPAAGGAESLLPAGTTPVRGGSVNPNFTSQVRGPVMTVRTAIGWVKLPENCAVDIKLCDNYGQKVLVVEVSWYDNEAIDKTKHSPSKIVQTALLSPEIGEAAPSSVPRA